MNFVLHLCIWQTLSSTFTRLTILIADLKERSQERYCKSYMLIYFHFNLISSSAKVVTDVFENCMCLHTFMQPTHYQNPHYVWVFVWLNYYRFQHFGWTIPLRSKQPCTQYVGCFILACMCMSCPVQYTLLHISSPPWWDFVLRAERIRAQIHMNKNKPVLRALQVLVIRLPGPKNEED